MFHLSSKLLTSRSTVHIASRSVSSSRYVLLFPGQGIQRAGAVKRSLLPSSVDLFDKASDILGYDLLDMCEHGSEEEINRTDVCQPAILVCSLFPLASFLEQNSRRISGMVGLSLGEITAMVTSNILCFEDGVRLAQKRGQLMQEASLAFEPSGLMVVKGVEDGSFLASLRAEMEAINKAQKEDGISTYDCAEALYLSPSTLTLAGSTSSLQALRQVLRKKYRKVASILPVSGAFHSPYMASAQQTFRSVLKEMDFLPLEGSGKTFMAPQGFEEGFVNTKLVSNVTGKWYFEEGEEDLEAKREKLRESLVAQVCFPTYFFMFSSFFV